MLPPQLVSYGLQHISQSPDRFIRDSVARHLGSLLDYVSLAQDELIPSLGGPAPADPDPLPQLLGDLWGAAGLGAGDNAQVVHGRWPLLEQETLAVFRRVKKALGMAEGRPESAVAAQEPFVPASSPPDSPILTGKALRETPRFAQKGYQSALIPRTQADLARLLDTLARPAVPVPDEIRVDVKNALRLKPQITKAELSEIAALMASIPAASQRSAKGGGNLNPILKAAEARRELMALVQDPEWDAAGAKEVDEIIVHDHCDSPPIFPRRFDSVYYGKGRGAAASAAPVRPIVPDSLAAIGKALIDVGGLADASMDGLEGDPAAMAVLDAMQGFPTLPSDITFSPPTSSSDDAFVGDGLWTAARSTSPSMRNGDDLGSSEGDLDVVLPRRSTLPADRSAEHRILEPSALRHSLSLYEPLVSSANLGTTLALPQDPRTISPVLSPSVAGEAGSVRSERARDSFGLPPEKAVQEVLSALGGRSLVDAQERIDGPLAKEEEADFPVPSLASLPNAGPLASPALPSSLVGLASSLGGSTGASGFGKASGLLSLGLELGWRPFEDIPGASFNAVGDALFQPSSGPFPIDLSALERSLLQADLSDADEPAAAHGTVQDDDDEHNFILTRRELGLRSSTEVVPESAQSDEDAAPPKKRRLRDLSEESDGRQPSLATDEQMQHIFDTPSPPADLDTGRTLGPDSDEESVDEPVRLADGEVEMSLDVPLAPDEPDDAQAVDAAALAPSHVKIDPEDAQDTIPSSDAEHPSSPQPSPSTGLAGFLSTRGAAKANLLGHAGEPSSSQPAPDTSLDSLPPSRPVDQPSNLVSQPANVPIIQQAVDSVTAREGGGADEEQQLHCVGGQKVFNNHAVWKAISSARIALHYRASPLLSLGAPDGLSITGLDALLTPHVGLIVHPLAILPSFAPALRSFLPTLRGRVEVLYIVATTPADRDVWTDAARKAVGQLRRSSTVLAEGEEALTVRVGWAPELALGEVLRGLILAHQTSPGGQVPCLGGEWLGALEEDGDEQWEQDELHLSALPHFNAFMAAWVLYSMTIDDFLQSPADERLATWGPLFGRQRMSRVNTVLASRLRRLSDDPDVADHVLGMSSLPPSLPLSSAADPWQLNRPPQLAGDSMAASSWMEVDGASGFVREGSYLHDYSCSLLGMLFPRVLALLSQAALGVVAVQQNLAGVVDWHKAHVGLPLPPVAALRGGPSFETFKAADGSERTSIITLTRSNIAASLNAETGSIEWRHQFPNTEVVHSYFVKENALVLITSKPGSKVARHLDALTGAVLWEVALPFSTEEELAHLPADVLFATEAGEAVLYVLAGGGETITRLRLSDGARLEVWTNEDSNLSFDKLIQTPSGVSALGHLSGIASGSLVLHPLDPSSLLLSTTLATTLSSSPGGVSDLVVATRDAVAWLDGDDGAVWAKDLTSAAPSARQDLGGRLYEEIMSVGLDHEGVFLGVHSLPGVAMEKFDILHLSDGGVQISAAVVDTPETGEFVRPAGTGVAQVIFASNGNADYIVHVYGKDAGVAGWSNNRPHDADAAADSLTRTTTDGHQVTLALSTSGTLAVYKDKKLLFEREEALSEIRSLTFVDLPEAVAFADDALASESFVTRHVAQLKHIPDYLVRFVSQFFTSTTAVIAPHATHDGDLHRDQFGLRKVVVAATSSGAVFGLDSLDGSVLWKYVWDGIASRQREQVDIEGTWLLKAAAPGQPPIVAVLAVEIADGVLQTSAVELNALTGQPLDGQKILFPGRPRGAFLVASSNHSETDDGSKTLRIMDKDGVTSYWPTEAGHEGQVARVTTTSRRPAPFRLQGYGRLLLETPVAPLWELTLREGEVFSRRTTPHSGAVASLGKVTGDRTVLYKYLNPHLLAYSTVSPATNTSSVYVVDTSRGSIVYETTHRDVDVRSPVEILLVENWLVYTFKSRVGPLPAAQQLVSVELYESNEGKSKLKSSELSTASADHAIKTFSRTYLLPGGVRALGVTETRHGITAKDLIIANDADQIVTVPRRGLDPRRPFGPPSAADKLEQLVPYEPYMPFDPKRVVSHGNEVLGIKQIHSSPALLESTSILLATGLDLFQTRVMPSGGFDVLPDSFNKLQLILTILGLTAGVVITKPIVDKRKLRAKWY